MEFQRDDPGLNTGQMAPYSPPPDEMPAGFAATVGAFARRENVIGSAITAWRRGGPRSAEWDPNYDPLGDIKGTPYEGRKEAFLGSRSMAETQSIKNRLDMEDADRDIVDKAGALGIPLGIAAGILDPTIFLPAGGVVRAARGGYSVLKSGASIGIMGGVQTAVQEGILQGTQLTRPLEESAINVATGTILAGLLGAGASKFLSNAENRLVSQLLDRDRAVIGADLGQQVDMPPAPRLREDGTLEIPGARITDDVTEQVPANDTGRLPAAAAGAAAADTRTLDLVHYGLDRIPGVRSVVERLSPTLDIFSGRFVEAKRALADLAETSLVFTENLAGVPTSRQGPPVDRLAKLYINQARLEVDEAFERLWMEHRGLAGDAGYIRAQTAKFGADIEAMRGNQEAAQLTFDQFKKEVGKALRRDDQHEIPQVAAAAKVVRERVFNPWRDRITGSKQLREAFGWPEDVEPKTAESYFQRVWNREALRAKKTEAADRITGWLASEQAQKAAIKENLIALSDQLLNARKTLAKLDARDDRLAERQKKIDAAIGERLRETNAATAREGALEDRAGMIQAEIDDLAEFVEAMKREATDPRTREIIESMEADLAYLRKLDKGMSLEDLDRLEREERAAALPDPLRKVARIVAGEWKEPKPASLLSWIRSQGGIATADAAEVRGILGNRPMPGLINSTGRPLDEWGMVLAERFGRKDPDGYIRRYDPREVLDMIDGAQRGRNPPEWDAEDPEAALVREQAKIVRDLFDHLGIETPATGREVADILVAQASQPQSYDAMVRELDDMDAAGAAVPASMERMAAAENLGREKQAIREVRALIDRARNDRGIAERRLGRENIRINEAGVAVARNQGRLGILDDQYARNEVKKALLEALRVNAEDTYGRIREQIDEQIVAWKGKSTVEAIQAIEAKAESERVRGLKQAAGVYGGDGSRLTSADGAVDRAVKRIIESDRDLTTDELRGRAYEIIDRIISSPNGRLPYEASSASFARQVPGTDVRGPLARREFMIPDHLVEDFLESDADRIAGMYLHTMAHDVLMTERFGDVNMTEQFRKIQDEANRLIEAATSEKERVQIGKDRDRAINKLSVVRDRIRGVYDIPQTEAMRNFGRISRAIRSYNVMTDLGGSTLNSLADLAGPVFRYGFMKVFGDAYRPFVQSFLGDGAAWKAARRQYKAMGIAVDVRLNTRLTSLGDIVEDYQGQSRFERVLHGGATAMQIVNLQAPWTDFGKTVTSVVAGNEILRASKAVSLGTATPKQIAQLAQASIDQGMAARIWKEFAASGGEVIDGVHLPNTADWKAADARDAFEAAVAREADIAIVTAGAEKPIWLSGQMGALLGQYKTFTAAATERIMIANLQKADANTLSGLMAAVSAGMLSYVAYSLATEQKFSSNPADWVREGVSRSGVLGWLEEANALSAKATGNKADIYRLIGSEKPLTKFSSRSIWGQFLGPTAGKIENVVTAGNRAAAGDWSAADTKRLRRLAPFQNLPGLRNMLDRVEEGVNEALGVPPRTVR
jgi:hypothetical protein